MGKSDIFKAKNPLKFRGFFCFKPDQLVQNSMELVVAQKKNVEQPQIYFLSLTSWSKVQWNWWLLVIFNFTMGIFKSFDIFTQSF